MKGGRVTREGPFWDVMQGRAAPPPAATLLGWELVAAAMATAQIRSRPAGRLPASAVHQRSRCTTSLNGRRSGPRTGISGRSAG
jgi:hypothetical protein